MTVRTRDGRSLHVERFGEGTPIVVFESGMGVSRAEWGAVVPAVATRTSAVVYDRSGLGRSPVDPQPRTLDRLASDLLDVLDDLGDGPFVLVGHSWGGPIIRVAASRLAPARLAGLVLVDVTDERCDLFFESASERQARLSRAVMPLLARTGLLRIPVKRMARSLPEPWATAMRTEDMTLAATRTQLAELAGHIDDLRRLHDEPLVLPDVPVTVISGEKRGFMERNRRPELLRAHAATAASFPQGRHVLAPASSHYVPLTDAPLVVDEVLRIVDAARQSSTPGSDRSFGSAG
ncbi:MAG TPA: alpha/beta hydrolase [Acidimicrobiales bacterium]|nr:alpha/beta hydrolase [Acidimicrobiales bacterium]